MTNMRYGKSLCRTVPNALLHMFRYASLVFMFSYNEYIVPVQNLLSATSVTRSSGADANGRPPCMSSYWFT